MPIPVISLAVVAYAHSRGSEGALALSKIPEDQRNGPLSCLPISSCSLKSKEDLERERVAGLWIGFADDLGDDSQLLDATSGLETQSLEPLFLDRAPSRLKKHLRGWKLWVSFCAPLKWRPGSPSLPELLDCLYSLSQGCFADRGRQRKRSVWSALSPGLEGCQQVAAVPREGFAAIALHCGAASEKGRDQRPM